MSFQTLKLAVCLFDDLTVLDYQGPMDLFGFICPEFVGNVNALGHVDSKFAIEATYLGPTEDPIKPGVGPLMLTSRTYDIVRADEQFDMLLIPGGPGTMPHAIPQSLVQFVRRQAPGATYVLSVCMGSWVLAQAGLLEGKRATTNKSMYKLITEDTKDLGINWIAKARWVIDGKYWTSSGITAGIDMASAFLVFLVGEETAAKIRGITEVSVREQGDDEFADYYGLV